MKKWLKIAISSRVFTSSTYYEKRDGISQDWSKFLSQMNIIPIIIPNNYQNILDFLNEITIDGIILSGGDNLGDFPERDATEKKLIDYGISNTLPIFGVCRGMQILNNFFGGNVLTTSNGEHIGKTHVINILNESMSKLMNSKTISVNSFHNNLITSKILGNNLIPMAIHNDDSIEAFIHEKYKIMGVMWHPERQNDSINKLLFSKFFQNHKWKNN